MENLEHASALFFLGTGMIALTVVIHAAGVVLWLKHLGREIRLRKSQGTPPRLFRPILTTAIVLLLLHILEAFTWAVLYRLLPGQSGLESLHDAFYFSIVTFTTLGYGDLTLSTEWQMLSGLESMIGILVFGMSTALLLAVVQKSWQIAHDEYTEAGSGPER